MKRIHKGWEIEAKRDRRLGGWDYIYFHATRLSDGFMMIDSFTEGDTVRTIFNAVKKRVDEAINTNGESECCEEKFAEVTKAQQDRIWDKFINLLAADEPVHPWVQRHEANV